MCTVRINEVKRESERGREEHLQCLRLQATCSSSTVCSGKRSVCACGRKQVRQTPGKFSAPQTAHSDAAQTAPIHDAFKRNEAVISAPTAAAVAWENKGTECWESLNGFGRVRSGFARMGCSVSFICCEEDFLQMPVYHHGEEKKKGSPKKVSRSCQKGGNARVANVRRHEWASNFSKRTARACLRVCSGCFRCRLGLFICLRVCVCACSTQARWLSLCRTSDKTSRPLVPLAKVDCRKHQILSSNKSPSESRIYPVLVKWTRNSLFTSINPGLVCV